MIATVDDFLEHYGKKGMRWGVRNARSSTSSGKSKKGPNVKNMSDQELRDVVKRMQLEQQYSSLTKGSSSSRNKRIASAGAAFVGGIALNVARTQATNALSDQVGKALKKVPRKAA